MYFPSKKDSWLYVIMIAVVLSCFAPLLTRTDYGALFFTAPLAIVLTWCWFTTGYEATDEKLIIRSGPFKSKIDIPNIRSIRPTKNPLSSIALSIDRLEIIYGPHDQMTLVSPQDKQAFIEYLTTINPSIQLK